MPDKGILYLVPVPLDKNGKTGEVIPGSSREIISTLGTFIVENPKTARLYLKQLDTTIPLQQINLLTLDEHTPDNRIESLLQPLLDGKHVGLMSEAGCPAVADPGARLVKLAHARNIRVVPLVGPSSILLALMASGFNGQRFVFLGYLSRKRDDRRKELKEIETESRIRRQTQIFIEAPYRNNQLLADILSTCDQNTLLCLATDITLATESIRSMTVGMWKDKVPEIDRRPTVFLLSASE